MTTATVTVGAVPGTHQVAPPHTFILFGATGDLAHRKLFPALYSLYMDKLMPEQFAVVGVARTDFDDAHFRDEVRSAIEKFGRIKPDKTTFAKFVERFFYKSVDVNNPEDFRKLKERVEQVEKQLDLPKQRLFYLAMAPNFFGTVALSLKSSGLSEVDGWRRLIIEKPFGRDLESARVLNNELRQVFEEEEIYRIDHYLGKEMVQNIEVIRFANSIFEPLWNNRSIANVQITSSEVVGVEDRASYYEKSGALRDMVQNHMLQMVMMVAMEPPSRLNMEAIRDEKVKVLRSLRRYTLDEVMGNVVRGQYTAGTINGKPVKGYREEPNVAPNSSTETFVAARLYIDNFRWAGVPFYIRTGKHMAAKATEIVIQFRDLPKDMYFNQNGQLGPNLLRIRVNPQEGMSLLLNAKQPGTDETVVPVSMEFSQSVTNSPEAYERLLLDAMQGDSTFFTRWDEVSLAWKFVDPIAEAFHTHAVPLHQYAAGSWGPKAAEQLLHADGNAWWPVHGQQPAAAVKAGNPM
ncbi:glucose-6-phosphate 1-dehydrogenase [Alicyclobacillus contaminans]|uniref:glucose-6-phosphate dehydrogenase n=1 Tax=Alicyclobacillus contaminans TaxID=392016 RepID=UPI000686061A|nr:glucose-6-phosphate dehydrogenase [Alicyclobacillus contaminans]GMA49632.1 glucose-6-phosphate 1-dehydrogenase [Alicyclobacillus contaminans]